MAQTGAVAAPAIVRQTQTMTIATPWPASSGGFSGPRHRPLSHRVERLFGRTHSHHPDEGRDAPIDELRTGAAHGAFVLEHQKVQLHPALALSPVCRAGWDIMARKRTPGALPGSTARAARPCGTACG